METRHPVTTHLTELCERVDRDGIDAHAEDVHRLARAVARRSPVLADVLTGPFIAPMRERALARAVRLVLLRPERYAELAAGPREEGSLLAAS